MNLKVIHLKYCSLDDLPDDLKSILSDLCVLAYEGVMQNKVVFYRDDLRKFNLPANLVSSGGSNVLFIFDGWAP